MKKIFKSLLACLLILIIFAGAVFFIGWTQWRIAPNSIGVLKSKTCGIQKEPIYSGKFSWHWEFLLPTNAELKIFELKPYQVSKKISGELPSGDVYSSALDGNVDFSYSFDYEFSVKVSADTIVSLLKQLVISDQDGLERYLDQVCDSAAKMLTSEIMRNLEKDSAYHPDTLTQDELMKLVNLSDKFPLVEFNSVVIRKTRCPDYVLYSKARTAYLSQLEGKPAGKKTVLQEAEKVEESKDESEEISEEDAALLGKLKKLLSKQ